VSFVSFGVVGSELIDRFSALKMDGKPLYEYARESKPLPRAIPVRECTVSIDLIDFRPASVAPGDGGHEWTWPKERLSSEEKTVFRRLTDIVHKASESAHDTKSDPAVPDLTAEEVPETSTKTGMRPPSFKVRMTVSSGTYVRSIVHDIGLALGCGAHVVTLTRTRQGEFSLYGDEEKLEAKDSVKKDTETTEEMKKENVTEKAEQELSVPVKAEAAEEMTEEEAAMNAETAEEDMMNASSSTPTTSATASGPSGGCIPWAVWTRALEERDEMLTSEQAEKEEARANGIQGDEYRQKFSDKAVMARRRDRPYREWEVELLKRFQSVPVPIGGSHSTARFR
jgi:tRNA pseudouridine55 synthase